jgi:hypothetical protein
MHVPGLSGGHTFPHNLDLQLKHVYLSNSFNLFSCFKYEELSNYLYLKRCVLPPCLLPLASYLFPAITSLLPPSYCLRSFLPPFPASCILLPASWFLPCVSYLLSSTSSLLPPSSCLLLSCLLPQASSSCLLPTASSLLSSASLLLTFFLLPSTYSYGLQHPVSCYPVSCLQPLSSCLLAPA